MSRSSGFEGGDLHNSGFGISALLKGSWDMVIGVISKEATVIITKSHDPPSSTGAVYYLGAYLGYSGYRV